jgi:hypothetical protein
MNRHDIALKISHEIWNQYLSPCNNKLNLKILEYLLTHYFLLRYEEIAREYHITIDENDKVGTAIKCFETFIDNLERNMRNYEITEVNSKESD